MGDPLSHTHIPVCSLSQATFLTWLKLWRRKRTTGSKLTVHEPFNKPLLKHKVIGSLKHSVGADMGVWKYENTLQPLDHFRPWWTITHKTNTVGLIAAIHSLSVQSFLSIPSFLPVSSGNHLKEQNCSTELVKKRFEESRCALSRWEECFMWVACWPEEEKVHLIQL